MSEMEIAAIYMGYEEWYEEYGDELWVIYHEEGANYDQNYEDWCERKWYSIRQ